MIHSPLLMFDFPNAQGEAHPLRFRNPSAVLTAGEIEEVLPVLRAAQAEAEAGRYVAGYVLYEAAPAFDAAFQVLPAGPMPLAWFGVFAEPLPAPPNIDSDHAALSFAEWQPGIAREEYDRAIAAIREAISWGEVYQANYTFPLSAPLFDAHTETFSPRRRASQLQTGVSTPCPKDGDPLCHHASAYSLYQRLRDAGAPGYAAFLDLGRYTILSLSPELFFERRGTQITTRPMKGTRPRGRGLEEDARLAEELVASEKDRAENLMIVDLLRNDLGRLAVPGTVQVPQLFSQERYPTVWQMTSTITAECPPTTTLADLFTALFPCGSITGAPKIAAMRLLTRLETVPRQIYCGAIGLLKPGGDAVFNVAIRTLLLDRQAGTATYGVGGGITWDSTPEGEYAEALTKAAVLTEAQPDFDLLETLRLEEGVYALKARHLARLEESAHYFDRPLNRAAVEAALEEEAQRYPHGAWRVRLQVSKEGQIHIGSAPLLPVTTPRRFALAARPVSSGDRFLFHKTTHRTLYETAWAEFSPPKTEVASHRQEPSTVFDVLLWNERGELTEFTRGNLVVEQEGRYWTPPRACGLLAGTLRQELLESGRLEERILTPADLTANARIWFINSVRGWIPMCATNEKKVLRRE